MIEYGLLGDWAGLAALIAGDRSGMGIAGFRARRANCCSTAESSRSRLREAR